MIELIVLDVDGCLSDGKITYDIDAKESKSFNVKDGLAIASWIKLGKKVAIITGRNSSIVEKRANELHVNYLYQGVKNKKEILSDILKKENLSWENVAAIGDDMNDLEVLKRVALSFTPNDGVDFLHLHVKRVLNKNGGDGAVREMIDILIKNENLQEEFIKLWS